MISEVMKRRLNFVAVILSLLLIIGLFQLTAAHAESTFSIDEISLNHPRPVHQVCSNIINQGIYHKFTYARQKYLGACNRRPFPWGFLCWNGHCQW